MAVVALALGSACADKGSGGGAGPGRGLSHRKKRERELISRVKRAQNALVARRWGAAALALGPGAPSPVELVKTWKKAEKKLGAFRRFDPVAAKTRSGRWEVSARGHFQRGTWLFVWTFTKAGKFESLRGEPARAL